MNKINRESVDETLANMFSSTEYSTNYLFYAHMISQCTIKMDNTLPAAAGVAFNIDHYDLYINEDKFSKYTLKQRLGIMKHEMLHILQNHVHRTEDRAHLPFNFATDCAINQLIDRNHLPDGAIFPDNLPVKTKAKLKQHAEYYYDLLKDEAQDQEDQEQDCDQCDGSGEQEQECSDCGGSGESKDEDGNTQECQSCDGSGKESHSCDKCGGSGKKPGEGYGSDSGKLIDDHGTWNKSQGDKDLQKDMTKRMIEQSINQTQKSRGKLPQDISDMLSLFTRKSQVDWKKVLKSIVGNKKVGKRATIMRKPRRFNNRPDLKGTTKDRMFTLVVGVDISGSMSTDEIMTGLQEIHHICKLTKTKMKLIQIDTEVHAIQDFDEKTKLFERRGCGGTIMEECPKYILNNKLECDALVMISDCYIEDISKADYWLKFRKRVIWLATQDVVPPGIESMKMHKCLPLKIS